MNSLDRRTFLGTLGAGVLAARASFASSIKNVGVQLYTVRTDLEKDFDGTLARVAAIGYKEVEFAGYFKHSAEQVHDALKKHGLTSPAAHVDYPTVSDPPRWAKALDDAATIGHKFLVNPWIDETVRNQPDAWKRAADV
jgi:sugar phosphate isomerase/epimerase